MITVRANARNATYISDDLITSGSVGIPVTFVLSEDFDGLSAIAVFEGSGTARDVALMGNTCVVPHEVLATAGGYLRIGIYASNSEGTIVIPTVWAGSKLILQGTEPSEVDPSEPTPSWAAQVQAAAAEALANSEEAIEIAGGADAAAEEARQSASAAATSATAAGQSAEAASGSATSASGSASAAAQSATAAAGSASDAASSASAAAGSATAAAGSAAAAAASEAAAREVQESIPQDYTDLSNDVSELKSQMSRMSEITESKELFDANRITEGRRLDMSGYPFVDANAFLSNYIPVTVGNTYFKNSPVIDAYHRMATYSATNSPMRVISDSNYVTIEAGEAKVRFCGLLSEVSTTTFKGDFSAVDSVARQDVEAIDAGRSVALENGYAYNANDASIWAQGTLTISGTTVVETDSPTRIRTIGYVQEILPGVDILKAADGYEIIQYSFNANGSYASIGEWTNEISGITSAQKRMRVVARKTGNAPIVPAEAVNVGALMYNLSGVDNIPNIESYIDTLCESRSGNGFEDIKAKFGERVKAYIDEHGSVVGGVTKTYDEMYEWLLNRNNCIYNGALHKSGKNIVNASGQPVVLHGIGTHYLLDYESLHTTASLETLKYYGINCLRITAYTADNNFIDSAGDNGLARKQCQGYISLPDETKAVMDDLIAKCVSLGLYCIVDWHILDGQEANSIASEMNGFFTYFSNKYNNTPNVLYELLNEPFSNTAAQLATVMKGAYDIIRANAPNAVIVTGIGSDGVAPMYNVLQSNGMSDVFISAHYYQMGAGTDYAPYVQNYYDLDYPMFYTEWGNSNADGAGTYYDALSKSLMDRLDLLGVSNCCWKFTYQNMATGTLKWSLLAMRGNGFKYGGFNEVELSHNGKFYFKNYQDHLFRE